MPIYAPDPFEGIQRTLLTLLTQRQQNEVEQEQLKIQKEQLKLKQQQQQMQQQAQAGQDAAAQAVIQAMLAQGDPTAQTATQAALGVQAPPSGNILGMPFSPQASALPQGVAIAMLPQIQQTQESQSLVKSREAQTKQAEVATQIAEKERDSFDAILDLDTRVKEAQIARDEAITANDTRRTIIAERELGLQERQLNATLVREARTNVTKLHDDFRAMTSSLSGVGLSSAEARRIASLAVYGQPDRPTDEALQANELRFLNASLTASAGDKQALDGLLKARATTAVADRIGMPDKLRTLIDRKLEEKSAQEVYDEIVTSKASDEVAAMAFIYLQSATDEKVEPRTKERGGITLSLKRMAETLASITPEGQTSRTRQPIGTVR